MVEKQIIEQIRHDFQQVSKHQNILGVILFGSYVDGQESERSDIDICLVVRDSDLYSIHKYIYATVEQNLDKYDIRFFEELPLYIQGEIIERGQIILTPNIGDLTEYLYRYRKRWNHEKWRQLIA
jgi:uncharacterized protein